MILFFYHDNSEILETWNRNSSFKYFWVVRIEKQIRSFVFLGKVMAQQFCFEICWPLVDACSCQQLDSKSVSYSPHVSTKKPIPIFYQSIVFFFICHYLFFIKTISSIDQLGICKLQAKLQRSILILWLPVPRKIFSRHFSLAVPRSGWASLAWIDPISQ